MKTRNGFVSNSSSSSFIVAIKEPNVCPHCGRSDVNFLDLVKNSGFGGTYIEAYGVADVIAHHEKFDEALYRSYQRLHPDSIIVELSLSNHDILVDEIRSNKDIIILEDMDYS